MNGFRSQAEKDSKTDQYKLAKCCMVGDGVEQNYTEAFKWFSRAARSRIYTK